MSSADWAAASRCPRCLHSRLDVQRAGWICEGCSAGFPVVGGVPWLFAEPQAVLAEWRGRLELLVQELQREARVLRAEAGGPDLLATTRRRLEVLAAAHEDHATKLQTLLAPLGLASAQARYETHLALRTRLPVDQGLTNYYANIHRDWAWGDEENAASLNAVESAVPPEHRWGCTLVLGAGAGRLAYDIHRQCGPEWTLATDFNPLLLFVARDAAQGRTLELYEFPIAARRVEDQAVLRRLTAPEPVRAGFHLAACDVSRLPLAPESVDTVVTPWLIDIVSEPFPKLAARINQVLRPGGCWINFGSVAFSQGDRAQRFGLEEVVEIVEHSGFARPQPREIAIPYMRSPASRHARFETVVTWAARKERAVPPPEEHSTLPEWLVRPDLPVPALEDFQVQSMATRIHAFMMALIDGKRTVSDMARMLVEQKLMTAQDAEPGVRAFLARMYEDSRRRGGI